MGNIGTIVSLMRKFTPKGQEMALGIMRRDKKILEKPYGFLEMPARLSGSGELGALEREMKGNSYLSENMYSIWAKQVEKLKLNEDAKFIDEFNLVEQKTFEQQYLASIKFASDNKQKIIEFIRNECKDVKLADKMLVSSSAEDIQICFSDMYTEYLLPQIQPGTLKELFKSKKLFYFQDAYKKILKSGDLCLKFWKTMLVPPTDKRIVEITNILKSKYGLKYVYLETQADAEKMLKAVEFAKSRNIPLPQNVIMTSAFPLDGEQNVLTSNLEHTVFINPNMISKLAKNIASKNKSNNYDELIEKEWIGREAVNFSTPDDLHVILHEFEHCRNFTLTNIKIPAKHRSTVSGLMNYSRISYNRVNDEIRNELLTKRDIMGLNEAEENLLKLWA